MNIMMIIIMTMMMRFVILHGTDTLAYTSSALSFMLENLGKPVIVTGFDDDHDHVKMVATMIMIMIIMNDHDDNE